MRARRVGRGLVRGMVRRRVAQHAVVVLVVKGKAEEVLVAKGKAENREEPRMVEEQLRLLLLLEVRLLVVARLLVLLEARLLVVARLLVLLEGVRA